MMLTSVLATIVVGFLAFAVYVDGSERRARLASIDTELSRAQGGTAGRPAPPGPGAPEPTSDDGPATQADESLDDVDAPVQLTVTSDGAIVAQRSGQSPFTDEVLGRLAAAGGPQTLEAAGYRIKLADLPGDRVQITALSLDQFRADLGALRRSLALGGLVIVTLEGVVVWLLAERLARPLATMTETANRIADGDLDAEVSMRGGSREIEELSADLQHMVDRLRSALDEQERSAKDATEARDNMQRFLADVSHEIRTPLTSLKGYSDLYQRGMLAEPGALDRAMERVGSESVRLHGLVNGMLALAREEGPSERVERYDLASVLRDVVDDLRVAYPDRAIRLQAGDVGELYLEGDPAKVHQALLNVGSNACSHTEPQVPVELELAHLDGECVVSVIDHGAGIPESEAERIFLPFYRPDASRSRTGTGGAGLGLAVVKQIVAEQGGTIAVQTTQGGGATFELRLPRRRLATERPAP
ncbi:MAG: HAMP domain-containing sensor histidine kinase [Microthrixaceae bacterium]